MGVVFFIFCFLNFYGPISTNITLIFNLLLFIIISSLKKGTAYFPHIYILIPSIIFAISVISFLLSRDTVQDYSVFGTYLRILCCCCCFPTILRYFVQSNVPLLEIILVTLLCHCFAVLIQMAIPSLQSYNDVFFRYNSSRDDIILENFQMRRLGLTGSFDAAAFYSVLATTCSFILYLTWAKKLYFLSFAVAYTSSLFTSRMGMIVSSLMIVLSLFQNKKHTKGHKLTSLIVLIGTAFIIIFFIIPIIGPSIGLDITLGNEIEAASDYSDRTGEVLLSSQWLPLMYLNVREFLFGYGCGVRETMTIPWGSDIGYVKQIFEVGIIGIIFLLLFCYIIVKKSHRLKNIDRSFNAQYQIIVFSLFIYFIFNFKNYFIFGVCSFEFFLIISLINYYSYKIIQKRSESIAYKKIWSSQGK